MPHIGDGRHVSPLVTELIELAVKRLAAIWTGEADKA
jgi:hypothetical protein